MISIAPTKVFFVEVEAPRPLIVAQQHSAPDETGSNETRSMLKRVPPQHVINEVSPTHPMDITATWLSEAQLSVAGELGGGANDEEETADLEEADEEEEGLKDRFIDDLKNSEKKFVNCPQLTFNRTDKSMPGRTSQENLHSIGADVGTLAMAGGAVVALNEANKAFKSEDNALKHAIHAGIGVAAAAGGYEMVRRATEGDDGDDSDDSDDGDDRRGRGSKGDIGIERESTTIAVIREGDGEKRICKIHRREHRSPSRCSGYHEHNHHHHHHYQRSRSASRCSDDEHREHRHHHKLHLAEEVIGAWGIVKEAMGDKGHKGIHVVEEVLGALGVYGEAREHQKNH